MITHSIISIGELETQQRLFKMAANLHIMSYIYRHTALFLLSSSLCAISNMQLYRPPPPFNPILPIQSLNTPTPPSCQKFMYVIILIVLLTSHDCLGDGRQKCRWASDRTIINSTLSRYYPLAPLRWNPLGPPREHPPGPNLDSTHPASSGTTRPSPRLGSALLSNGAEGQTHKRTLIHICALLADRNTIIISFELFSFTSDISNLFNIRF